MAFKVIIFPRLEPPSLHGYGIQSHHLFTVIAFRATISSQLNIQSHFFDIQSHFFNVQSHILNIQSYQFLVQHSKPLVSLAFRATIFLLFGIQSHIPSIQSYQFLVWHSEPSFFSSQAFKATFSVFRATFLAFKAISFSLTFRVIIFLQLGIQSHIPSIQSYQFLVWHSEPLFSLTFRAIGQLGIQSCHFLLVWYLESLFNLTFKATIFPQFWHSKALFIFNRAFRVTIFPSF